MKKLICYSVAFMSLSMLSGCHAIGVIVPHRVVYASHTRTHVYRPRIRYRHVHVRSRAQRPQSRVIRNRYVRRQNIINRTVIHRHYYDRSGAKNRRHGKKGKRR